LRVHPQNRYSDLAMGVVASIECLEAVALELAPQDLDRALRLATLADELRGDEGGRSPTRFT
jgi:hypothetical protein